MKKPLITLALISIVSACSVGNLPGNLSRSMMNQDDPAIVEAGAPAYLLLLDALILTYPDDEDFLLAGARLYGAYAGVFARDPAQAKRMADKAMNYARRALCEYDEDACTLLDGPQDQILPTLQDDYDEDDPQAAWRVTWMDGQTTWVPYNFPADHPHGVAGKDFSVHLSPRLRKEHMELFRKGSSTGKRHRDAPLDCFRVSASQSDLEHVVPRWHPAKRQRSSCPHIIR